MNTISIIPQFVIDAIETEMEYQNRKWGVDKEQSLPGMILVMKNELAEAEEGWTKGPWVGRQSALSEIVQVAATAIRTLSTYGVQGCPAATNDIVNEHCSKTYDAAKYD